MAGFDRRDIRAQTARGVRQLTWDSIRPGHPSGVRPGQRVAVACGGSPGNSVANHRVAAVGSPAREPGVAGQPGPDGRC